MHAEFDLGSTQMDASDPPFRVITAEYGDELITLSTCSYHTDNGRFVVVAKKKCV